MTTAFYLSYALLWVLVAFLTLVVLGLIRSGYRLQQEGGTADGTLRGRPLPEFDSVDLAGEPVGSSTITGRLTALLFVGSDCSTCELTLNDLEALHTKARHNVIVICQGEGDDCAELAERYQLSTAVVPDREGTISELFSITAVPTAVIVGEDGRIATIGNPMGGDQLEKLIDDTPEAGGEPELVVHHEPAREGEEVAS